MSGTLLSTSLPLTELHNNHEKISMSVFSKEEAKACHTVRAMTKNKEPGRMISESVFWLFHSTFSKFPFCFRHAELIAGFHMLKCSVHYTLFLILITYGVVVNQSQVPFGSNLNSVILDK